MRASQDSILSRTDFQLLALFVARKVQVRESNPRLSLHKAEGWSTTPTRTRKWG